MFLFLFLLAPKSFFWKTRNNDLFSFVVWSPMFLLYMLCLYSDCCDLWWIVFVYLMSKEFHLSKQFSWNSMVIMCSHENLSMQESSSVLCSTNFGTIFSPTLCQIDVRDVPNTNENSGTCFFATFICFHYDAICEHMLSIVICILLFFQLSFVFFSFFNCYMNYC